MESWVYILFAIIFWGLAPIFGKFGLLKISPLLAISIRSFGLALILVIVGLITGELGNITKLDMRSASFILAEGLFAGLLGHFSYYYALQAEEISRVVLLARAAPVVTVFISIIFLGESFSYYKLGGMCLIVLGAMLMSI